MKRLPIRWKVAGAFASSLLVVLIALGAFVYLRFDGELGRALDRGLSARMGEVVVSVTASDQLPAATAVTSLEADENVAQVFRADGSMVASSAPAAVRLLTDRQLSRARSGPVFVDRPGNSELDEDLRLLATPVSRLGEPLVVVVGASLDDKNEALASLLGLQLLGSGVALVLASLAGYVVSGVALRPVDAMRRRAAEITDQPDVRLPVPPVDDELGRLGRTLNEMLERLDRAQQSERQVLARDRRFVEDASHELRTPLTVLKGELEVALIGDRDPDELRAAVVSALEETERLCRLSEDLLLLAQTDEGQLLLHLEQVDIAELVARVVARVHRAPLAARRKIRVDPSGGGVVCVDATRVEQALDNLLDNAVRYGAGDIEIGVTRYAGGVAIGVRDHGAGFPAEFADRAFERFSRADAGRTGGGSGLGLSIVEAIAHAHGGTVALSAATPGARVTLTLPAP